MSQIRKDILTGDRIVFATNRMNKPYYFSRKTISKSKDDKDCPFCPGNEDQTPKEICRCGDKNNWEVRVFKNLYPAVEIEQDNEFYEEFYQGRPGTGIHEVIVDTPEHAGEMNTFSNDHMLKVLNTLKNRFTELEKEDFVRYVQIFKNNGPEAGASIAHSHWQIMGLSYIPIEQKRIIHNVSNYYEEKQSCLICDIIKQEQKVQKRIVFENEEFIVFVPFAARFGFEMFVVPKNHVSSFKELGDVQMSSLSEVLIELTGRVKRIRDGLGFNLCFQDKPKDVLHGKYHWYLRVLPRIGALAGFEYSTGSYINPILPEDSAKIIREV